MPASTAPAKEQNNTLLQTTLSETSTKCLSQRDVCLKRDQLKGAKKGRDISPSYREYIERSKERQGPTLGVCLIESKLKGVEKRRDQL